MIRISFIVRQWPKGVDTCLVGGSSKSPFRLIRALDKFCTRKLVVCFVGQGGPQQGVVCCPFSWGRLVVRVLLQNVWSVGPVYRAFKQSDVVQCHHPHYGLAAAALKRWVFPHVKFVVKAHGTAIPELQANRYPGIKGRVLALNARMQAMLDIWVLAAADKVLCSSVFQQAEMMNLYGVPQAKLQTLYNGFDAAFYPCSPARVARKEDEIVVGFCGRVVPKKNIPYVFDVCAALHKQGYRVRLKLVLGEVSHVEDRQLYKCVQAWALAAPYVVEIFHDMPEPALAALLQTCHVGLVPSVGYESIPSVVYEFAAAGARVFATYNWGIPEVLRPEYALTGVAEEDATRLAKAVSKVGNSCLKAGVETYAYQNLAAGYVKLYESLSS